MRVNILIIIAFFLFLCCESGRAENYLLFRPLTANIFEPRIGSFYQFSDNKLRLDIGASYDIASIYKSDNSEYRLGADFFTYTRLRSENNFKFPVETSDYFFGINQSGRTIAFENEFFYRIRLAHISSHLVDGYARDSVFHKSPFVYSREFFTISLAKELIDGFRIYLTLEYVFSKQPDDANPIITSYGIDFNKKLSEYLSFIIAYDFKLLGFDSVYSGVHNAQLGILAKVNSFAGVFAGFYGYSGKSMHGLFYSENDEYIGLGFQVVFY